MAKASVTKPKRRKSPVKKVVERVSEVSKKEPVERIEKPVKEKRFPLTEILIGIGVIILLLLVWLFFRLPKADIVIWPKVDTLTLHETIVADASVHSPDVNLKTLPARYVEVQKQGQQPFPATGSISSDQKASGTITVYNKISPSSPFTLIAGTHFLSDSGKYFVTTQKVVVPAAKGNTPGTINVTVQAQDTGSDYNVGPSKFSAPKLSGTTYYYSIYAQSNNAMAGGSTGKSKQVTSDDIASAKDVLTKKLLQDAQTSLKNSIGGDDIIVDGAMASTIVSATSDVPANGLKDTFNESATVKAFAMVIKKQDLQTYIKSDATSQLPAGKNLLDKNSSTTTTLSSVDMQAKKETLQVTSSIGTYHAIDTNHLSDVVGGKSSDQIKQLFDQLYHDQISELKVNLWPFWVTKAPTNKNRITIELKF